MNLLILVSTLFFQTTNYADTSSIYQLQLKSIDNHIIDMSLYRGKQIIFYEFDAADPDKGQMVSLDSLFKSKTNLVVIAIPVQDFNNTVVSTDSLNRLLRDSFQVSYPVTDLSMAKKSAGPQQHPLLDWATHLEKNEHFNDDVNEDGYMYVISTTGILYSIVKKEISATGPIMQQILNNEPLQ